MFDRTFMPALTFTLLVAAFSAFAGEIAQSSATQPKVERLERVVITAQRGLPATPVASADAPAPVIR